MRKIVLLLIVTIVIVPIAGFYFSEPLTDLHWATVKDFCGEGFTQSGLWGMMRPNYAWDQGVWVVFYFFSVAVTGSWLNWSVVGCSLSLFLFRSSSDFNEKISAEKYPDYANYQKRVPRFIPFMKFAK